MTVPTTIYVPVFQPMSLRWSECRRLLLRPFWSFVFQGRQVEAGYDADFCQTFIFFPQVMLFSVLFLPYRRQRRTHCWQYRHLLPCRSPSLPNCTVIFPRNESASRPSVVCQELVKRFLDWWFGAFCRCSTLHLNNKAIYSFRQYNTLLQILSVSVMTFWFSARETSEKLKGWSCAAGPGSQITLWSGSKAVICVVLFLGTNKWCNFTTRKKLWLMICGKSIIHTPSPLPPHV